jgi:hypothetical protein
MYPRIYYGVCFCGVSPNLLRGLLKMSSISIRKMPEQVRQVGYVSKMPEQVRQVGYVSKIPG